MALSPSGVYVVATHDTGVPLTTLPMPTTSDPQLPQRSWWNAGSLCFVLPIENGHRVVVLGAHHSIAKTVAVLGAEALSVIAPSHLDVAPELGAVVVADTAAVPVADGSADHVIVLHATAQRLKMLASEVLRMVKPGGSVLLGAGARRQSRPGAKLTPRTLRRILPPEHFQDVRVYSVHPDLEEPRHIVPLDAPAGVRWYLHSAYVPGKRREAVAWALLPKSVMRRTLLPAARAVVARRVASASPG